MDFGFFISILGKFGFLIIFIKLSIDNIEFMSFPESLSSLSSQNRFICRHFLIMMLKVFVRHDIVVFEILVHIWIHFHFEFFAFRTLLWSSVVMICQLVVTNDVIVNK